jgi:hypothetical protein
MSTTAPVPDLVLYGRPDCALCDEARDMIRALLAQRLDQGLPSPGLIERDIDTDAHWQREYFALIPVLEFDGRRIETVTSLATVRQLLDSWPHTASGSLAAASGSPHAPSPSPAAASGSPHAPSPSPERAPEAR